MSTAIEQNCFAEGEVCDAFDAFIDPKYVEEPEGLNESELFRYYFEDDMPGQVSENSSPSPTSARSPAPLVPPTLTNVKMEENDLELVLQTLLNSVDSQVSATTEPSLLHTTTTSPMQVVQPSRLTATQAIVPAIDPQNTTRKSPPKNLSRPVRASSIEIELDPNDPDIQKLSSKERRQLRNKISARNFRVRRKEYIATLEEQVQQYQSEVKTLRESFNKVEDENSKLRSELEQMRNKFDAHVPASDNRSQSPAESSVEPMVTESTAIRRSDSPFKPTFKVKSGVAPLSNGEPFNKDIPNNASNAAASPRWQDSRVIVH
ncbi:hypothetical protein K7432_004579 [Basidiobolus ranarum]|uniref:BZIP domain-containing protein n=1 Tax=Basidiobolus ranarum TaxID=34480 RepID=A0ABR2W4H1_9FUNG